MRIRIQPDRMTDRQLWDFVRVSLYALDPLDPAYRPGHSHQVSLNGQQALAELRLRGTQLALDLPQADDRPNQVA